MKLVEGLSWPRGLPISIADWRLRSGGAFSKSVAIGNRKLHFRPVARTVHCASTRSSSSRFEARNILLDAQGAPHVWISAWPNVEKDSSLTQTAAVMGVRPICPPGTSLWTKQTAHHPSDVYAWELFSELLAGRAPFRAEHRWRRCGKLSNANRGGRGS
jgi:hypothetical protein